MASNPQWCLTEAEWRAQFTAWLSEPTPERLLNANIFFDFRALYGDGALVDRLWGWLLARTQDNKLFLRLMVQNALETEPPLGLIRAFQVSDKPGREGTLDLKKRGARIFVDAARVFALAHGTAGSPERRRAAAQGRRTPQGRSAPRRSDGRGVPLSAGAAPARARSTRIRTIPIAIDPYALNEVDQRMLKESFRQARKLQQRLKETFSFASDEACSIGRNRAWDC